MNTYHLMREESLALKTKKGLFWSSFERFGAQAIQFIFGIILARLLSPEDYGLIAMPLIFLALAQCLIDSGFTSAIIRKPSLKEEDLSTAFFFSVIVGIVCYIILFLLSDTIAGFYNVPELSNILRITALATIINPLCIVQQSVLTRKLEFKIQAKISIVSQLLTGVIGLSLAYSGFGVWSLVIQQIGGLLLRTILLWIFGKWYPKTGWSKVSFDYLWGYGSKILLSSILETIYSNIYPFIIGKFYKPADLGNYTRANTFANFPSSNVTTILQKVTFPVLSSIQDDDIRLQTNYRKFIKLSCYVIFPLMMGLSSSANSVVNVLLGEKWEGCVILLKIVCFNLMWFPVHAINLNLLQVKGRSELYLKLEIIKKIVGFTILIISVPFGLVPLMIGGVVTSVFALFINTYYTGKLINVGFTKQMRDIAPMFFSSIILWIIIEITNHIFASGILLLIADIFLGILIYFLLSLIFMKDQMSDLKGFIAMK